MIEFIEEIIENSTIQPPSDFVDIFKSHNLIFEIIEEQETKIDKTNFVEWDLKGIIKQNNKIYLIHIEGSAEAFITYSEWTDTQHYNIETYIVEEII